MLHLVRILLCSLYISSSNCHCVIEFTEHQRNVFCVFSGVGVTGLRHHLNNMDPYTDDVDIRDDDDATMTGMMGAAALNAEDDDGDGDEELDDGDGDNSGVGFNGHT
jgi:F-box and leucine-rich repeat protein GRR1